MKNIKKGVVIVFLFVLLVFCLFLFGRGGQEARKDYRNEEASSVFYWTGGGDNNNWSSAANWDQGKVPGADSVVIFNATSQEDSFVDKDFAGEISSLKIEGYEAKITQNNNLIIGENYYQDSGEYNVVADLDINGDFIQKEESIFLVSSGETRIGGKLEVADGFRQEPEAIIYVKNFDDWKMFILGEGKEEYYATKEDIVTENSGEVWSFYNATNSFESYVSQEKGWTLSAVSGDWSWNYLFEEMKREEAEPSIVQNTGITAQKNRISIQRGENIEEWYENTYKGIEQGFTIKEKPQGDGKLVLNGRVTIDNLTVEEKIKNNITLKRKIGAVAFEYGHLLTIDAANKEIPTELKLVEKENGGFDLKIIVDDSEAQYPIMIDPLSSSPDWVGLPSSDQQNGYFGKSVSSAGDVNGDGFEDILVGHYLYNNGEGAEGALHVYYGSEWGLSSAPDWTVMGPGYKTYLGYYVTSGDFNGDGFSDVVGGADYASNGETEEGRAFAYYGHSDADGGLSDSPDWTAESGQAGAHFAESISNAGDVDGDGCDDLIVGAHYYKSGSYDYNGKAYLYLGDHLNGLSGTPIWTVVGGAEWALLGEGVSKAGDVNKDGFGDVIVGAPGKGGRAAYIYLGGDPVTGLSASPNFTISVSQPSLFGYSVSDAGDINGDTWPDLLVGAPYYENVFGNEGAIFVFYGKSSGGIFTGFSATPDWQYIGDGPINSYLGHSVSSAGDINHDGFSDIIAGERGYDGDFVNEGRISVFYGKSGGLTPGSSPDWTNTGGKAYAYLGYSVSEVGDIRDNGYAGVMAGAYGWDIDPVNPADYDHEVGGKVNLYDGFYETGICVGEELLTNPACDKSVDKENVLVNVSTVDRALWYDDRCTDGVDNDEDGKADSEDSDCDRGEVGLNTYAFCDGVRKNDYEYFDCNLGKPSATPPVLPKDDHYDYYYTDTDNPTNVQPAEKNFTIKVNADDAWGIKSIKIQWFNGSGNANYSDWVNTICSDGVDNDGDGNIDDKDSNCDGGVNVQSFTCKDTRSCEICVKNGGCENDVIPYSNLGIDDPSVLDYQRLFFRAIITDNNNNTVVTGYDNDKTRLPVLDKSYRFQICSSECSVCANKSPVVTTERYLNPGDFCDGLDYTLDWNFSDPDGDAQSYYEVQIRDKNDPTGVVLSAVRESNNTDCRLFQGFLDNGDISYNKTYEWRVRAYDDSTEEDCRGTSDWTPWTDLDTTKTFTTPSYPYPNPSFTLKNDSGVDCTDVGVCELLDNISMDGSGSTVSVGSASYSWYIFDNPADPEADTLYSSLNPAAKTFLESDGISHIFRLTVTDGEGHSCSLDQTVELKKPHARWNEVAPTQ